MTNKPVFNGDALMIARRSRGISQKDLASEIGITPATLCKLERDDLSIKEDLLEKIANVLRYPKSFFAKDVSVLTPNIIYYRKRAAARNPEIDIIDSQVHIERFRIKQLLKSLDLNQKLEPMNPVDYDSPEHIARIVRNKLSVPTGPIKNLVSTIERAGVLIVTTDYNIDKLDGMVVPDPDALPVIYINKTMSGDRQRATLAHEFGHWIMHNAFNPTALEDVEDEAYRFAGEFLVPAKEFQIMVNEKTSLSGYADLKRYWKVSIQFLVMRAYKLKIISDERYRSLFQQISRLGYRKKEPIDIPIEVPVLISSMIRAHLNDLDMSIDEIENHIGLLVDDIRHRIHSQGGNGMMKVA
ncbi:ImmA/IrrE family metallo-endopeptidase [Hymenobacter oligotrophus]|uniref:ImmA/IrrE family metallo-endopeptidase n=1 Tax=Hymenobacter oligotrophus TaxID=2319843 RepID=A0A3B7R8R3_9BACT|nr:ImmA/IrrE family metallo-endopeptidase [Hymenobacter oligotrophus]AYA37521.1 ImmA/IrrE family metallo-endopeptidase [Hymenobacter oligotrophus]